MIVEEQKEFLARHAEEMTGQLDWWVAQLKEIDNYD